MSAPSNYSSAMAAWKARKDAARPVIHQKYKIIGFISSGTYGRVFKAKSITGGALFAIKKFKPDQAPDKALSAGISQSATREISLCVEYHHENVVRLQEVMLGPLDRSIYMVFEYAEHDFLQILQYHTSGTKERKPIPEYTVKSFLWQLLNGVLYLHSNWILHRDLKPANILVTAAGVVKIGDLGLARKYQKPLAPLYNGDKVIVTIWYRAIELLLGSRHYTKAIDVWAIGCIFAELMMIKPIFKGEEAKMDNIKKVIPFQKDQCIKIFEILGTPTKEKWPEIEYFPDYPMLANFRSYPHNNLPTHFKTYCHCSSKFLALDLLEKLLEYDPGKRISCNDALAHGYWLEEPRPGFNSFIPPGSESRLFNYQERPIKQDDTDLKSVSAMVGNTDVNNSNKHHHQASSSSNVYKKARMK